MNELSHNPINVEIVTPETSFTRDGVYLVLMPGVKGEFGVSPGHVPLLVGLQTGLVTCYNRDMKAVDKIFIDSGFVEVTADHVTLLVEKAVSLSNCKLEELVINLDLLTKNLEICQTDVEKQMVEQDINFTKSLLEIIKKIEWNAA